MNAGFSDYLADGERWARLLGAHPEPEIDTPDCEGPATYSTLDELIGAETY